MVDVANADEQYYDVDIGDDCKFLYFIILKIIILWILILQLQILFWKFLRYNS